MSEIEGRYQYQKPVRVVPREVVEKRGEYQQRHELSLLELLIQAHPERAKMIIKKLLAKPQDVA